MKTVVLSMIVRQEEKVIKRCIDSWKDHVDYWVIVDTGSTDKTMDIIKSELKDKSGELFERKWISMGHNRAELMKLSRDKADYHICLDADETLEFYDNWRSQLNSNEDRMFLDGGNIGTLDRIFKTKCNWTCNMAWHAGYTSEKPETNKSKLIGSKYLKYHHYADGVRSRKTSKEKYDEVVNGLKKDIEDNGLTTRKQFYLGQSYKDAGDQKSAIKALQKRIDMGGWQEEVYWAKLYIARMTRKKEDYLEAIKHTPSRIEAIFELSKLYNSEKNKEFAYKYAKIAAQLREPTNFMLFHNVSLYQWKCLDYFILVAYSYEKYEEAITAVIKLLKSENLPKSEVKRIISNLDWCWKKIYQVDNEWSLHDNIVDHIRELVPDGKTIIELGSGYGTSKLTKHYQVYSIEHDKKWLGLDKKSNYIFSELKDCKVDEFKTHTKWYNPDKIELPEEYDLVLVDGPPGSVGRGGLLKYLYLFKGDIVYVFNDVHRKDELKLLQLVSDKLNQKYEVHSLPDGRKFGLIKPDKEF